MSTSLPSNQFSVIATSPVLEVVSGTDCAPLMTWGWPGPANKAKAPCGTTVLCHDWARESYDGSMPPEDPLAHFLTLNQISITTGHHGKGVLQLSGQASGQTILSWTGHDNHLPEFLISKRERFLGGANFDKQVNRHGAAAEDAVIPHNFFHFKPKGTELDNGFVLNLNYYPRHDPFGTYSDIYTGISGEQPFYNLDFFEDMTFFAGTNKRRYTWIPTLARATGVIGGYFWHVMKYIGSPGGLTHAYRDLDAPAQGKDGIGRFLSFTGCAGNGSFVAGADITAYDQDADGHDYTGMGITAEPSTGYKWSRSSFETGQAASFLYDITNGPGNQQDFPDPIFHPPAPSTGIVDVVTRYMARNTPDDWYKCGSLDSPCQDPHVARPSAVGITHDNVFRGTSFSALFIKPLGDPRENWDFDFEYFQSGLFEPGWHGSFTAGGMMQGGLDPGVGGFIPGPWTAKYPYGRRFYNALTYGNRRNSQGVFEVGNQDGFHPITHYYHHKYRSQSELDSLFSIGMRAAEFTLSNWYNSHVDNFAGAAAPFDSALSFQNDTKSKITYIPIESALGEIGSRALTPSNSKMYGSHPSNPHKACGHRFLSGIRCSGTTLQPELGTQLLNLTRSNKIIAHGGKDALNNDVTVGEIVHPKFELWHPYHGDQYEFMIWGSGIYVFPLDTSRPAQFATGASYSSLVTSTVYPAIRPWFCPDIGMDSLEAAKRSLTQTIDIGGAPIPAIYSYRINMLEDFEATAGGGIAWKNGNLNFYNHLGEDILEDTWPYDFTQMSLDEKEYQYDLFAGQPISTIAFAGKFWDGEKQGYNPHNTSESCYGGSNMILSESGLVYWTTGYGGLHRYSTGVCCNWEPDEQAYDYQCIIDAGYATMPPQMRSVVGTVPFSVLSESMRSSFGTTSGVELECTCKKMTGGGTQGYLKGEDNDAGYQTYPFSDGSMGPSKETKEINFYLSHPNRGFVQFNPALDGLDGPTGEGALFEYGIKTGIIWDGAGGGCDIGNVNLGGGSCGPTPIWAEGHVFEQNRIVTTYEFSGIGHNFTQKFVIPSKEVWIEELGHSIHCSGVADIECPHNVFTETNEGECRHVYMVQKVWCPIVFHQDVRELKRAVVMEGADYDINAGPFTMPQYQMPFPDDVRCGQQWPVIMEWSQFDMFGEDGMTQGELEMSIFGPGGATNPTNQPITGILPEHSLGATAPNGTFRDSLKNLVEIDKVGQGFGYGYPRRTGLLNDGSRHAAGIEKWNGVCLGLLHHYSAYVADELWSAPLPYKSGVGGNAVMAEGHRFCLRLTPEATFNVKVENIRLSFDKYFGALEGTHNPNMGRVEILSSSGWNFQTYGGEYEGDFISYQNLIDSNLCTFNVRHKDSENGGVTGPSMYVATHSSGFCAEGVGDISAQQKTLPAWTLDSRCERTAEQIDSGLTVSGHKPRNKTALMKDKLFYNAANQITRSDGNQGSDVSSPYNNINGHPEKECSCVSEIGLRDDGAGTGGFEAFTWLECSDEDFDNIGGFNQAFQFQRGTAEQWTTLHSNGDIDLAIHVIQNRDGWTEGSNPTLIPPTCKDSD